MMVVLNLAVCKFDFGIAIIYILLRQWAPERDKYAIYTCHFITVQLKNCNVCITADLPSLLCNELILQISEEVTSLPKQL